MTLQAALDVALVGCGQISKAHIATLAEVDGVRIAAVCDHDPEAAERAASVAAGAAVHTDASEMLRTTRPAAVHVLTPPATHAPLAIEAIEAGCHVLVEKPMATSVHEAESMIDAARRRSVVLTTSHNYLFKPSVAKARRLAGAGALGDVVGLHAFYGVSHEEASWSGDGGREHWAWKLPGGALTNFLPHLAYLTLDFLGDVEEVEGVAALDPLGVGQATELGVVVRAERAVGHLTVSMATRPYLKFVEVYGTRGAVHADLAREICTVHRDGGRSGNFGKALHSARHAAQLAAGTLTVGAQVAARRMKPMPGLRHQIHDFYRSIATGRAPAVTAEDGRRMLDLVERIQRAA